MFLAEIEARILAGEDFAFETTLAGRGYLRLIQRLKAQGWDVELFYMALPSVEASKLRVRERVAHGGHDIPVSDIERRFPRSLHNLLADYRSQVDKCVCYMNDGGPVTKIFEQAGDACTIDNQALFDYIASLAGR